MPPVLTKFGPADFREQPWKNGGGTTLELRRAAHPDDAARFAWRLSIATVASAGPFSVFPGVDRSIMLLDGAGFVLRFADGTEQRLDRRWQPFAFRGDAAVDCTLLGGEVRDFNLMADRALFRAELAVFATHEGAEIKAAPLTLVYALEGAGEIRETAHGQRVALVAGELAEAREGASLEFRGGATWAVATLAPR